MAGTDFLRTFSKKFTNLTSYQRKELERVFLEAQDSKELTSLETSLKFLRRNVNQSLPIPQPTSNPTIRGSIIEWPNLSDQRISFYEVDVSTESNFSSFDTYPTFGTAIVLDGLTQTNFVRVRGVRRDGTVTPYSSTVPVIPNLFAITAHTAETTDFLIEGTDAVTVLGGLNSDLDYTSINPNGNSMVWGFLSIYGDPAVGILGLDKIVASVIVRIKDSNENTLSETTEWRLTVGEFWQSHGIGPFTVPHPQLGNNIEIRLAIQDVTTLLDGTARSGDRTRVTWAHLTSLELGI